MARKWWDKLGTVLAATVGAVMFCIVLAGVASAGSEASFREEDARGGLDARRVSNASVVTYTLPVTGGGAIADSIGSYFGVPLTEVLALRLEGLGYGEIAKVFFLAGGVVTPTEHILELREAGMGWGVIAKELSLTPGNHGRNLGMIVSGRGTVTDTQPITLTGLYGERGSGFYLHGRGREATGLDGAGGKPDWAGAGRGRVKTKP